MGGRGEEGGTVQKYPGRVFKGEGVLIDKTKKEEQRDSRNRQKEMGAETERRGRTNT